jgi:hypothetical protein
MGEMLSLGLVFEKGSKKLVKSVLHYIRGSNNGHLGTPFPKGENFFQQSPDCSKTPFYNISNIFAKV